MPGVQKQHRIRWNGRAFPASRYDDPRGGRPSALELNILRYRAVETAIYLFYAVEVRDFMVENIFRQAVLPPGVKPWEPSEERRLHRVLSRVLMNAELAKTLSAEDGQALRLMFEDERKQGKQLKIAFGHAIKIGMFTEVEANEVQQLLAYRNDIAHRIHLVMSDVSRSYFASDHVAFSAPTYKVDALDRLRAYRNSLWDRTKNLIVVLNMDSMLFEFAEHAYEAELKRLDRLIQAQIEREVKRAKAISTELDLHGTELVDDLAPRHPRNHRTSRSYGDDYVPPTGHLTKRGVEICYRLYDMGKSPMAVAYLMGMTLRSAQNRQKGWLKAGGTDRIRAEVRRYAMPVPRPRPAGDHAPSS